MTPFIRATTLVFSLVFLPCSYAATSANTVAQTTHIQTLLKKQFPELPAVTLTPAPIPGLYQATAGSHVFYISQDGRYIVSGEIIDLQQSQENLTEITRKKARLEALKSIDSAQMIVFSPKNPQYTVTVFTDVDCGYCKKLQSEMEQINSLGIAVRYMAFPRSGPGSETFNKMRQIWCAKDKKLALREATNDHHVTIPQQSQCSDDVLKKQLQLGLSLGVSGTPTILFEDGTVLPGYLPPDKLLMAVKKVRAG